MRTLDTIYKDLADSKTGRVSQRVIHIVEGDDRVVRYTAGLEVDADGANGQSGFQLAAYMLKDMGLDYLANGGMAYQHGEVVGVKSWWPDVAIVGPNHQPAIFPHGVVGSKTSLCYPHSDAGDPFAYIDSYGIRYIVVNPAVIRRVLGVVLGCRCDVTRLSTGERFKCVVADVSGADNIGEASIATANAFQVNPSPRSGGSNVQDFLYEVYPGEPAEVDGKRFTLQKSSGGWVL